MRQAVSSIKLKVAFCSSVEKLTIKCAYFGLEIAHLRLIFPLSTLTNMLRASTSSALRAAGASATRMRSTTHQHHQLFRSRTFFSFASPAQALVKSHSETKVVPFSPEEMFDVVADVNKYHEFLPFCVDSRVLRRPNDNVMEAALRIGFKVFTESYTSRVIMKR